MCSGVLQPGGNILAGEQTALARPRALAASSTGSYGDYARPRSPPTTPPCRLGRDVARPAVSRLVEPRARPLASRRRWRGGQPRPPAGGRTEPRRGTPHRLDRGRRHSARCVVRPGVLPSHASPSGRRAAGRGRPPHLLPVRRPGSAVARAACRLRRAHADRAQRTPGLVGRANPGRPRACPVAGRRARPVRGPPPGARELRFQPRRARLGFGRRGGPRCDRPARRDERLVGGRRVHPQPRRQGHVRNVHPRRDDARRRAARAPRGRNRRRAARSAATAGARVLVGRPHRPPLVRGTCAAAGPSGARRGPHAPGRDGPETRRGGGAAAPPRGRPREHGVGCGRARCCRRPRAEPAPHRRPEQRPGGAPYPDGSVAVHRRRAGNPGRHHRAGQARRRGHPAHPADSQEGSVRLGPCRSQRPRSRRRQPARQSGGARRREARLVTRSAAPVRAG